MSDPWSLLVVFWRETVIHRHVSFLSIDIIIIIMFSLCASCVRVIDRCQLQTVIIIIFIIFTWRTVTAKWRTIRWGGDGTMTCRVTAAGLIGLYARAPFRVAYVDTTRYPINPEAVVLLRSAHSGLMTRGHRDLLSDVRPKSYPPHTVNII